LIGIDTNVLVRYIIRDSPDETAAATAFLESLTSEKPGFVPLVSIAELGWVLNRRYKFNRRDFARALGSLLDSAELLIEVEPQVKEALLLFESTHADFGDCLISRSAMAAGCDSIVTFDRKAAARLGMSALA
jgi:predicted nucleic-acid-binding protein